MKINIPKLLILLLLSCNNNSNGYKTLEVKSFNSVKTFGDSLSFTKVANMCELNGDLLLYDNKLSKFMIFNQQLEFIKMFGDKGNAKNEYLYVSSILTKNDTIIVKDSGHQRYKYYDPNGKFISSIEYNKFIAPSNQFALFENHIIDGSKSNLFLEFDTSKSGDVVQYGDMEQYASQIQTMCRNCYSFYSYNNKIFALSDNSPFVNIYDDKRELVGQLRYDEIDFVEKQQKLSELKYNKNKSYYSIVSDSYLADSKLYILISTNHNGFNANKVVVLSMLNDNYKIEKSILLEGDVYSSICVINNKLYGFNTESLAIEMYEI